MDSDSESVDWCLKMFPGCDNDVLPASLADLNTFFREFPAIRVFVGIYDVGGDFWNLIHRFCSFVADIELNHPSDGFFSYISSIYEFYDDFKLMNSLSGFRFLKLFGSDLPDHILYQIPTCFPTIDIFFESFCELKAHDYHQYHTILANSSFLAEFASKFLFYLTSRSSENIWPERLALFDIFRDLILFHYPRDFITVHIASEVITGGIYLLRGVPHTYSASLLLIVTDLMKSVHGDIDLDSVGCNLIDSIAHNESCFSYFTNWAMQSGKFMNFKPSLYRQIAANTNSLHSFSKLASFCDIVGPVSILTILFKKGIQTKVYFRAIYQIGHSIIKKYSSLQEVRVWIRVFIRRLFIFLHLAEHRQKYKNRSLYITEFLAFLSDISIPWLKQSIHSGLGALLSTSCYPPHIHHFFDDTFIVDEVMLREIAIISKHDIYLKTYPFDPEKYALVKLKKEESVPILTIPRCQTVTMKPNLIPHTKAKIMKPTNTKLSHSNPITRRSMSITLRLKTI